MKYRVLLPLYLFFLFYRLLYWGLAMEVVPNVYVNAIADTLVSFFTALFINQSIKKIANSRKSGLKQTIVSVILFSIACLFLWLLHWLIYTATGGMKDVFAKTFSRFTFQFFDVITLLFIGSSVSFAWFKYLESKKRVKEYEQLIKEKREAELNFLKAQINPHFIFNTLNAINFSIDKNNQEARSLVSDFADLFRFQLYESDMDFIQLESELEFIRKYIKINEVRMHETYEINFREEGDFSNKFIPPLILIPFIENSFKHASNIIGKKTDVSISIKADNSFLYFNVNNTKGAGNKSIDRVGGVGLDNVKKRLDILFSERYNLSIDDADSYFNIKLEIPLKNEVLYH